MTDSTTRCKPADFTPCMQVQFCQHSECRTVHKPEDCMHPLFFSGLRSRLQAGDRVTICQFTNVSWETLVSFVHVRIVKIDDEGVYVRSEGDMVSCDLNVPDVIDGEPVPVKIKRLASGKYAITGLEDSYGLSPDFDTRKDADDWVIRNARSVYLETAAKKPEKVAA